MALNLITGESSICQVQNELGTKVWPPFMQHDAVVKKHWPGLYTDFLSFQYSAYNDQGLVGVGNTIPVFFDEDLANLPAEGLDWAMEKSKDDYDKEISPNLLVAVQILINPEQRSKGLSYKMLGLMKKVAAANGINQLALPVRPTHKHLYPLIPIEEYMMWENDKGEPFDPWIRVHKKAGGELVSVCSRSMVMRGTIAEWQAWTGLSFKSSGNYFVEKALNPVIIDLDRNVGEYVEPNVWITHKV